MRPLSYYQIMRNCKDPRAHRYQMVQYALKAGVKPAARAFSTSPPVARKWLKRFKEHGYDGLLDLSRRPHCSPRATPQHIKDHIVKLQKKYRRLGARQVKTLENLTQAPKTIRKLWREAGVSNRRRRKKYITKQNLREVKRRFYLFQQSCEKLALSLMIGLIVKNGSVSVMMSEVILKNQWLFNVPRAERAPVSPVSPFGFAWAK